jgi:hypothetical protein
MGRVYGVSLVKSVFIVGGLLLIGYLCVRFIAGFNPFAFLFETFGITKLYIFLGFMVIVIMYTLFEASQIPSTNIVFEGNRLTYSGGTFLKSTKSIPLSKVTRVNFKKAAPFQFGDLTIELTGTEEKSLVVQYVADVEKKCSLINQLLGVEAPEEETAAVEEKAYKRAAPPEKKALKSLDFKQEVIGFIEDELAQGYGLEQIKHDLLAEGYPESVIGSAAAYVEKERKVSKRDKTKTKPKTEEHHVIRRFHLPVMGVVAMVFVLLVVFFFFGIGEEEEKEMPERIDVFLYDNLGLDIEKHTLAGSTQIYSRDELIQSSKAQALLKQNKANPLLASLRVSETVQGVQKRATVFNVLGGGKGLEQKTLVEIRFQAERDVDSLKIIESIPKTIAVSDEIALTQGGVVAEKDPILLFTFNDVEAGNALKAVYVINKEIKEIDTMTFAAEEVEVVKKPAEPRVCGDGKCVEGENYMICCEDCGCLPGFVCEKNQCVAAERDECRTDADCNDEDVSTEDSCTGRPKTCQNIAIIECLNDDGYCPQGCVFDSDNDCEEPEEVDEGEIDISGLNITGEQESPNIYDIKILPANVTIGEEMVVSATIIDANGKDDIARVWFEILELAHSHGEVQDMNDAGDDVYTATREIAEYYLEGFYHLTVFAQDHAGNRKKMQSTFRVLEPVEEE